VTVTAATNVQIGAITTTSSAIGVTATAGTITDNLTSAESANLTSSGTVTLTAALGIGSSGTGDIDTNIGTLTASTTTSGAIYIQETNGLIIGSPGVTTASGGLIDIDVDAGNLTVDAVVTANGAGTVTLNADGGTIDINAIVSSTTGAIVVTGDVITQDSGISTGGTATVTVTADNGAITMADATSTTSVSGAIAYSATGNVLLALLTSTSGNINVTAGAAPSATGAISDNLGAETPNISTSGTATLTADTGIGTSTGDEDIETSVGTIVATNNTSNVIFITEADAVTVGGTGLRTLAGNGDITLNLTTGLLTLAGNVTAHGTGIVTLNTVVGGATQSSGAITASGLRLLGAGTFTLTTATNDVTTLAADLNTGVVNYADATSLTIGTVTASGTSTSGINTGDPGTGGAVTINAPNGTITVSQPISTVIPASGGTATISISGSVTVNQTITAEGGNVILNGSVGVTSDIIVNFALTSGGTMTLSAPRDVLLNAVASTTGAGNISVTADNDTTPNGTGGVLITGAGGVTSAGTVLLRGTSGFNTSFLDATGASVTGFSPSGSLANLAVQINVDSTPAAAQVSAAGASITIDSHTDTSNSDIVINGVISTTTNGTVAVTADDRASFGTAGDITADGAVTITAGGGIYTSGDVTTTNDNVTYASAVILEGSVVVNSNSGAGDVLFSSTVDGSTIYTEDLTVTAGTGSVIFEAAVGNAVRLGDIDVNSTSGSSRFNSTVSADTLETDPTAPYSTNTVGNITTLNGTVTTRGNQRYYDNLRIDSNLTLQIDDSTVSGTGIIRTDGTIDAVGGDETLSLDSGRIGTVNVQNTIDANGIIGGLQPLYALVIVDSNGADFAAAITTQTTDDSVTPSDTDTINASTRRVQILASAGNGGGSSNGADANVYFRGPIVTNALLASTGANAGYNLYLYGGGTNVRLGDLGNTGILEFGDSNADSLIFRRGITATGQYEIYLLGIPRTYGSPVILGDFDTTVFVYPGNSVIDTTFGASGTNSSPAGANITIGGNLEGTIGVGSKNIEFIAGTAGDVTIVGNAGGLQRLGIVLVTNANDVTVNNVTADRFLQRTGTGTTTTNGTIDTNGNETFSVTGFQPDDVAAAGGTLNLTFGVNIVTTQIVINSEVITASGGVHLSATDGTNVGVVTLNNNGRIRSDLDVILQGEASIGIVINALGTARFGAPGSGDVLTGTQRDFVTTSGAPIEFRSNVNLVATPNFLADRFIVSTSGGFPAVLTSATAPILFAGTVDANYSDLDLTSGTSNINFRGAVSEVQRLFLRLNDTSTAAPAVTTTTVTFAQNLSVEWLKPTAGHYNVDILGTTTLLSVGDIDYYLPNDTVFLNTGRTTLGNDTADSVSVMYGLDTTASSHTVMAGTIVSRERMNLSPIVLTAGQTTTIYTSSWFDVSVEAVTAGQSNAVVAVGASVTTAAGSSLVLGHANSSTNFTFAGDVTVPQLNTTLPAGDTRWNLFILGSLVITGGGITTLNNRGHFQIGSSGGNNLHAITGGLDTSTCLNTTVAGNLSATDALTLTGGMLRILVNSPAPRRISTTTGTITLPYMVLADGVDLTVGSSVAVPIVTGVIEGTWGGADSDIRFESTGNVTVNGRLGYDIGDVAVIGAATAAFNGGLGLPYWNPVSTVTITQSTTTTFPGGIFAGSIQAASTAGNLIFTSGARLNGPAVSNISTSGTVTFGDAPAAGSSPDELIFAGGLISSATTPVTLNGDLRSFNGDLRSTAANLTIDGALTVSGNSRIIAGAGTITLSTVSIATNTSLSVGTESSGAVVISGAVGPATVSTGTALRLGSTGTTTVNGAVDLAQLQVDGGSTTFSGAVGAITPIPSVILLAGAGTTTFGGDFFATTVSAAGGPGAISFNGTTSTITNAATFSNSGTLSLGNGAGDTITFTAGLTAGTTAVNGTLQTTSAPIALGSLVSTSAIVTTGLNSASTINIGAVSGSAPTLTAGTITLTGSVSATGTISLNSAGNVTLSGGLSNAGSLVVTSSGTTTIAGGSATAVTVNSASIQLTKTPLSVTNATSLAGTSAVTLQSGSGINDASTSNSGTITISAGAGGFSQAANAAIYTRNTSGSAIQITTSGGGNAAIGTLFAAPASGDPVAATTVTVTAAGAVTDSNDPVTGSPVNNVRAGSFVVTGSSVGTATNPIEYYTTAAPVTTGKFLVSTAPNGAAGWLRRFDFSRSSSLVMGGTTGVYSTSIFNASTAASSSNGTHFGFASGQSIAIYNAASTSRSSYQFYIDSLIHNSRVVTFYVDTNTATANVDYYVRVYFGSGTVATNSMVTAPGSTTSLASATGLSIGVFSRSAVFSRTTDANGTISMEFKRPNGVTTGNWGVVGVEVAAVEAELTNLTELPQMLEGVSFDANGLTDETAAAIASNGFQGRLLDEASVMAARDQAIADWAAVGISPEQLQILQNTPVIIGDLSQTGQVGLARADHIVLDDDAMGLGWFVGGTDKEVPAGMMDLLTVMTHELGHRLGYEDLDASANNGHIMAGVLRPGERRQAITARTMVPQQPVSVPSAEITAVTPEKTADLFAVNNADVSGVASRISPPVETSSAEHFTSAKSIDGRPQQPAPVRLLLETESASSDSSSQLSLLDDLFADVITTLDALNQGSAGN